MPTGLSRVTSRTIKEFSMTNDRSVARRSFAETLARKSVEAAPRSVQTCNRLIINENFWSGRGVPNGVECE